MESKTEIERCFYSNQIQDSQLMTDAPYDCSKRLEFVPETILNVERSVSSITSHSPTRTAPKSSNSHLMTEPPKFGCRDVSFVLLMKNSKKN